MKQVILGTAGHIDHGKTSLIKSLTGINTDRLKEEQIRGITIELGFAYLDLPSGRHIGIVDVPGHERFVKNMVAGATGIDMVALVIAADEGVMPQTTEHLEICSLLNIQYGMIVLTKIDLVDEEWTELVTEDIHEFVEGTFLENAPIVSVSSATGEGIPDFIKTLDELSAQIPDRTRSSLFRLPVDRVFTMKGFGTVITGTLISGEINLGDPVMIYPSDITSKVRGIQVHNLSVEHAEAGLRTAINLQGIEKDMIERGDVISSPGSLIPNYMLDVSFHFLSSNPKSLKSRTHIRFHISTAEILGYVILLDREELLPGETTVAQIRLDSPVVAVRDDRFVIRSYSPVRTIGGGFVLNPIPPKHKRFKTEIVEYLNNLVSLPPEEMISQHLRQSGIQGLSFAQLKIMTNISDKQLMSIIQTLLSRKTALQADRENRIYIHGETVNSLKSEIIEFLKRYHKQNPLKSGMQKEELKSKLPSELTPKVFNLILNQMNSDRSIVPEDETVRLSDHKVILKVDQADIQKKILDSYKNTGLEPPYFKDIVQSVQIDPKQAKDVLMLLTETGDLIKVKEDMYFFADAVHELRKKMIEFMEANGEMTTPQFKNIAGVPRKYLIPLLEYFDSKNVTIRVGDIRKLRSR